MNKKVTLGLVTMIVLIISIIIGLFLFTQNQSKTLPITTPPDVILSPQNNPPEIPENFYFADNLPDQIEIASQSHILISYSKTETQSGYFYVKNETPSSVWLDTDALNKTGQALFCASSIIIKNQPNTNVLFSSEKRFDLPAPITDQLAMVLNAAHQSQDEALNAAFYAHCYFVTLASQNELDIKTNHQIATAMGYAHAYHISGKNYTDYIVLMNLIGLKKGNYPTLTQYREILDYIKIKNLNRNVFSPNKSSLKNSDIALIK